MLRSVAAILVCTAAASLAQAPDSSVFDHWTRASNAPVIRPSEATFTDPVTGKLTHWEKLHTFNPAAIVRNGKIVVLYRAEDDFGQMTVGGHVSRIGLAETSDGIHFIKRPAPVFFAANDAQLHREDDGGTEDPRIVEAPDGTYVMTYTQWSRKAHTYTVGVATSRDLLTWHKHGPIFSNAGPRYQTLAYKSAGIVTELKNNRLIAAKIDGHYLMYWGEITIQLATSDDLVHWKPVEDATGAPIVVLHARQHHFDSSFPEVGPPPVLTKQGIVLLYNGRNADRHNWNGHQHSGYGDDSWKVWPDYSIAPGTYSVGKAIFDPHNPTHLIAQSSKPVFTPTQPWERAGQYEFGTTFAEGLVFFNKQWWMYYGAADSFVGAAVAK